MSCSWWLVGLFALLFQVPPPDAGEEAGRELETAQRTILARESSELTKLSDDLSAKGETGGTAGPRVQRLPRPAKPDGATRFVPLPEIVPPRTANKSGAEKARLDAIQVRSASELFETGEASGPDRTTALLAGERMPPRRTGTTAGSPRGASITGSHPVRGGLGNALCRPANQERARRSPEVRLGGRRLATAPRARRAARTAVPRREGPLAPRRGCRPAPRRMETTLADLHRALRNPDQFATRRGDRLRTAPGSLPRPVHVAHGRYPRREHPDGAAIPRVDACRRADVQAACDLLFRIEEAVRSTI